MDVEGQLRIELFLEGDTVTRTDIASTRPLRAARIFPGKTPDEALRAVPRLFAVCGIAQSHAAVSACERALDVPCTRGTNAAREMLVDAETAREHLWRILLDWPVFLDEAVDPKVVAGLSGLLPGLRQALFGARDPFQPGAIPAADPQAMDQVITRIARTVEERVFDRPPADWLAIEDAKELGAWSGHGRTIAARLLSRIMREGWQDLGANGVDFLPPFDEAQLHARLTAADAPQFIARPDWAGQCYETTPLARQRAHPLVRALLRDYGNGLLARMTARLVELAAIPSALRQSASLLVHHGPDSPVVECSHEPGVGLGQVEAARGRLVHRVVVAHGRVDSYQILAPTEWNFHPLGVAAKGLLALGAGGEAELRRKAALWVNAIDPCVGYELQIR